MSRIRNQLTALDRRWLESRRSGAALMDGARYEARFSDGVLDIRYGSVEGLPPSDWVRGDGGWSGTYYIVSAMTALAVRASGDYRDDLLCPGEIVRDASGEVVGCRSLRRA